MSAAVSIVDINCGEKKYAGTSLFGCFYRFGRAYIDAHGKKPSKEQYYNHVSTSYTYSPTYEYQTLLRVLPFIDNYFYLQQETNRLEKLVDQSAKYFKRIGLTLRILRNLNTNKFSLCARKNSNRVCEECCTLYITSPHCNCTPDSDWYTSGLMFCDGLDEVSELIVKIEKANRIIK